MKKLTAWILALVMLCSCAAMAETAGKETMGTLKMGRSFELKCAIPEGYRLNVAVNETDRCGAIVEPVDPAKPTLYISIAYNELDSNVDRLNDLDPESRAAIEASFRAEDDVEITVMTTAHGTEIFVVREIEGNTDFVDFYSIYKGYEVELVLAHADQAEPGAAATPVTDEEIQMAMQFLSDLDFVGE